MPKIYVPSSGPDAWRQFLADPELQWKQGYSARTLACAWEASDGLPSEIRQALEPLVGATELLIAIPEHKVALPGGRRDSQCDVFALLRAPPGVIACAIEGKVSETFGPTVAEWLVQASPGKLERLAFIRRTLGLDEEVPGDIRYQLLHRAAAAAIEAGRFDTTAAAMIVHSFGPSDDWLEDFRSFVGLFGMELDDRMRAATTLPDGRPFYLAWARGDQAFRSA